MELLNWFGDDDEPTNEQIHKEYVDRQSQREELEGYLVNASESGDVELATQIMNSLQGELKPAFKELVYNKNYMSDLNSLYEEVNGEKYKGSKEDLVKDSFDHWNGVEQNITLGINELANSDYSDISVEGKKSLRRVFDTYYETDAFGAGSRDLDEQLYNLVPNTILDPSNLIGVGIGAKIFRATAGKQLAKKAIYTALGLSAGSGFSGATADIVQQNVEMQARGEESGQEYSGGRTLAVAGASTALPIAGQKAGKLIGSTFRGATHLVQSAGKFTPPGKKQALFGKIGKAEESAGLSTVVAGESERSTVRAVDSLQSAWKSADDSITKAFESVPKNMIPSTALDSFMNKIERDAYMDGIIPKDLSILVRGTKSTAQKGVGAALASRRASPKMGTYDALKDMKKVLYSASKTDPDNARHYNKYYNDLVNLEEKFAVDKDAFKKMKTAFKQFRGIGQSKGDPIGKLVADMATAEADNVSIPKKMGALINSMLDGKESGYEQLIAVRKTIEKAQKAADLAGVPDMKGAWDKLLFPMQRSVAEKLMENDNKLLFKLLKSNNGMKTLKEIYPDAKRDLEAIQKLAIVLGKGSGNRGSGSVIVNMTAARLAGQAAKSGGGGSVVQALASVSGVYGAQSLSLARLTENKVFRNAMVKAWKREDGRIDTKTMSYLKKKFGLKDVELGRLQDSIWAVFAATPVVKAEETKKVINSNKIQ